VNRSLARRLERLEAERSPATPAILKVQAICAATGAVISEQRLVLHEPKRHGSRTSMWADRLNRR
jgi:hypothetical protein